MAPTTLSALAQQGLEGVCNTPACLALSKTLLSNVNFNVDPCSDFFRFTCSGWLNTEAVKEKSSSYDQSSQTEENSLQNILSFLNGTFDDLSKIIHTSDSAFHTQDEKAIDKKNFELVQNYYKLCLDAETQDQLGVTPIYKYLAQIEHTLFPIADDINPKQLALALSAMALQATPTILSIYTGVNSLNHSQRIVVIEPSNLDEDVTYTSIDSLNQYRQGLVTLLDTVVGAPSQEDSSYGIVALEESKKSNFTFWSSSKIEAAVSSFIDFEILLSGIGKIPAAESSEEIPRLRDLNNASASIDWDTFLSTTIANSDFVTPDFPISFTREQLEVLESILSETPTRTLQEYFVIQTVKQMGPYLSGDPSRQEDSPSNDFQRVRDIFQAPTPEEPAVSDSQITCGQKTSLNFKNIIGRFFTLSSFGASKEKELAEKFVEMLYTTWLHEMLPQTNWIGKETMKNVIEKIEALDRKVVFSTTSPDWRSPRALEEYYEGLTTKSNYFDAVYSYNHWESLKLWSSIPHAVDLREWNPSNYPEQFNALYEPGRNSLEIPVGALQSPFYSSRYPEYYNYGSIGFLIGHELTHSLDSSGRFYDKHGYPGQIFTNEDGLTYDKKSQCFIDQFDKFSLLGSKDKLLALNGTNVLGENIADSGGLRIAYNAYLNYIKKKGAPEKVLPGFEKYTPEQLFFIAKAQFTCATVSKSDAQYAIDSDVHAPLYFRGIGALQNSVEFAKVFNCPVWSPMNPEKKCSVW